MRCVECAQRRPERQPRLHHLDAVDHALGAVRSTKAGASTPATLVAYIDRAGGHIRSTKAGASTPATPIDAGATLALTIPAQRRPERQPRLHFLHPGHEPSDEVRSTKAGASTPATPSAEVLAARGIDAQRRPERQPRLHVFPRRAVASTLERSTKAGASTPATHEMRSRARGAPRALNEGRSVNPGYTARGWPRRRWS